MYDELNIFCFAGSDLINRIDYCGLRKQIVWEDYWNKFKSDHSDLSQQQLEWAQQQLARGCVGVTCVLLGEIAKPDNCYKTKEQAEANAKINPDCCDYSMFSVHFWNDLGKDGINPDMKYNPSTGKVDMSNWNASGRPGGEWNEFDSAYGFNFDFGYLNSDGTIIHASSYHRACPKIA